MARRLLLAAILAAGVVWGYGSAIHGLVRSVGHCHQTERPAPSE